MASAGAAGVNGNPAWLPPLVLLPCYGGDWQAYLEAVHGFFHQDFVASEPRFQGKRCGLINPQRDAGGKEGTFWHVISEGKIEGQRLPDLRRCERIRWPRPIIEAVRRADVRCWKTKSKGKPRILIALEDFSYVVVLASLKTCVLLFTAFPVERPHRREKLRKEYEIAQKC
jgi:hypothetical protein